jgi:RND family efflux transporter MFP subunit
VSGKVAVSKAGAGRWILRIVIVAAIGGLAAWVAFLRNQEQVTIAENIRLPVVVARATRATVTRSFTIGSYVESEQIVTITPKASGTLLTLNVQVGDRVQAGELIAQIDREPYQLALDQVQTARETAEDAYERTRKLHEAGSASDAALEQVRAQFDAATTQLESATLNINNTEVRSPVTGLVMARHRSAGEVVGAGVPIVTVSNTEDLLVTAEVPERYIRYFVAGARPQAVRPAIPTLPDSRLGARITYVSPYILPESRTFEVASEITGDTRQIVPGMYVELEFVLDERTNVLTLPYDALVGGETLWYLDEEHGTVHSLAFTPEFDDDERFVLPDSYADYLFVVDGQHFLSDGLQVRVITGTEAP